MTAQELRSLLEQTRPWDDRVMPWMDGRQVGLAPPQGHFELDIRDNLVRFEGPHAVVTMALCPDGLWHLKWAGSTACSGCGCSSTHSKNGREHCATCGAEVIPRCDSDVVSETEHAFRLFAGTVYDAAIRGII